MTTKSIWILARIKALPISESYRNQLRLKEKRMLYWGGLFFLLTVIFLQTLSLPRSVVVAGFPLSLSAYVVLSVKGRPMVTLLVLLAGVMITAAKLSETMDVRWMLLALLPVFIFASAWIGRLQYVRKCTPELRNWPS
jgi:hypothetical protein